MNAIASGGMVVGADRRESERGNRTGARNDGTDGRGPQFAAGAVDRDHRCHDRQGARTGDG